MPVLPAPLTLPSCHADMCKTTSCPAHSSCQVIDNNATCVCSDGYVKQGSACVVKPASYGWLETHNAARAAVKSPVLVWNDTCELGNARLKHIRRSRAPSYPL